MERYPIESTEEIKEDEKVELLKSKLVKRFGTVITDLNTMETEQRAWEDLDLRWNCGEVSRITRETIGGELHEIHNARNNAEIYYKNDEGDPVLIADGHSLAIHAYVTDENGNVWDPTLDHWGETPENEYLRLFSVN